MGGSELVCCVCVKLIRGVRALHRWQVMVPVVGGTLLVVSVVVSVLATRAVARPLARISRRVHAAATLRLPRGGAHHQGATSIRELQRLERGMYYKHTAPMPVPLVFITTCPRAYCGGGGGGVYVRAATEAMQASLRSFAKYVPRDVVAILLRDQREATLGASEQHVSVRTPMTVGPWVLAPLWLGDSGTVLTHALARGVADPVCRPGRLWRVGRTADV
jgi:hypothetical protein